MLGRSAARSVGMSDTTTSPPHRQRNILDQLWDITTALPRGRVRAPVRGRAVAVEIVRALESAHHRRLRVDVEGQPLEILEALKERGLFPSALPHRLPAAAALRLLAAHTHMVARSRRGRFRIVLRASAPTT